MPSPLIKVLQEAISIKKKVDDVLGRAIRSVLKAGPCLDIPQRHSAVLSVVSQLTHEAVREAVVEGGVFGCLVSLELVRLLPMCPVKSCLRVIQEGLHRGQEIQDVTVHLNHHVRDTLPVQGIVLLVFLGEPAHRLLILSVVEASDVDELPGGSLPPQEQCCLGVRPKLVGCQPATDIEHRSRATETLFSRNPQVLVITLVHSIRLLETGGKKLIQRNKCITHCVSPQSAAQRCSNCPASIDIAALSFWFSSFPPGIEGSM